MNRRNFVNILGATSLGTLAGCTSQSNSGANANESKLGTKRRTTATTTKKSTTHSGPAHFTNVQLSVPDTVTVGEEFHITVSAQNDGGEVGDFTTTLSWSAWSGSNAAGIKIPGIKPGETKSKSFKTLMDTVGPSEYHLTDYAIRKTVQVNPATLQLGSEATLPYRFLASANPLKYLTAYENNAPYEVKTTYTPKTGAFFGLLPITITNKSRTAEYFPRSNSFKLKIGDSTLTPVGITDLKSGAVFPIQQYTVPGKKSAGETAAGVIVFEIPSSASGKQLQVQWDESGNGSPEVLWTQQNPVSFPQFSLESLDVPSRALANKPFTVSATLRNSGVEGYFWGALQKRAPDLTVWNPVSIIKARIPGGESITHDIRVTIQHADNYEFRLKTFDVIKKLTVK